jgi:TP901 family phage tail tape measure protein
MVGASFSVYMMLESVNRMGPGIRSAMGLVQNFKKQLSSLNQNITTTIHVKRIEETVKQYREQAGKARSKAMEQGATGAAIMAPVVKTVTDFAKAEDAFTDLRISAYDASIPAVLMQEELKKASEEAKRLGDATRFSTREAYEGMTTLVKGGASLRDVYTGLGQSALYLAQAGKVPVEQSAEAMVKISNAYQLTGEQMKDVADMINRVDGASTASIDSLQQGFKYAAGTAAQLRQTVNETAQALAVLNNRGLDGSTAGTNYADFLQRLIPMTKQQTKYMQELGWITENGSSIFFDNATGQIKSMVEVIGVMRTTFAGLKDVDRSILLDNSGNLRSLEEVEAAIGKTAQGMKVFEQVKYLHKIFGEQGGRAAIALMAGGKGSWEEVGNNIAKAMPLEQRIGEQMLNLMGRFENMMGSLSNLSADAGNPIGTFVSDRLDGITNIINKTRAWAELNPQVVKGIMWIVTSLGMLKLGSMVFYLIKAGLLGLTADFLSVFKWVLKFGGGVQNLKVGFDLIRATGAGFWRSLWQGAQLAWPWLARLVGWAGTAGGFLLRLGSYGLRFGSMLGGGAMTAIRWLGLVLSWIGRLVGGWMVAAVRIAAGWLIAMGPVGWIIAGVTAIIAAAIWAWNTNFMGFRDKCIQVWNAISSWAQRTWSNIVGFVQTAIGWIGGFIDKIKAALGLSRNLPSELPKIRGVDLDPKDFKPFGPDNTPVVSQGGCLNYTVNITNNNDISTSDPERAGETIVKLSVPEYYKRSRDPRLGDPIAGW